MTNWITTTVFQDVLILFVYKQFNFQKNFQKLKLKKKIGFQFISPQTLNWKNITNEFSKVGAYLAGMIAYNNSKGENEMLLYGEISYWNTSKVNGIISCVNGKCRIPFQSIEAKYIDYVIKISDQQVILMGSIQSISNYDAYNAIICDLITDVCHTMNGGSF